MARGISWRFILLIIAASSSQAKKNKLSYDPSPILFPGETERPARFPLPTTTTTPSPTYLQCFENCQSTSEYEPICGTDYLVYSNQGRLQCAQNCGKNVGILKRGQCDSNSRVPPSTGTTSPPSSSIYYQCINSCLSSSEYNPVCGTDRVVYTNQERLKCAQNCGKQVGLLKYGLCDSNSRVPANTGTTSSPSPAIFKQCFDSCISTSEYNPVCGTDRNVYHNIGRLRCAQNCGKAVEQLKLGSCMR